MSSRRTARVALITAAGVVSAGAITLLAMPANAATPEVTFTGKCSTLASTSEPTDRDITTQRAGAGQSAKVLVWNDLGVEATPYVDGSPVKGATVGDGDSVTLGFTDSGNLTLVPKCGLLGLSTDLLNKNHEAAAVTVKDAPAESKPGAPAGEQPGPNPGSNPGSGSGSDSDGVAGNPDSGSRPDAPKDPVARGAKPPADVEGGGRVGPDDGSNPDGDTAGAPAGSDSDNNSAAGGNKAGLVSTSHSGPGTTTLALIAVICLLGVAAAALRTIVVSRAARVSSI